MPLLSLVALFGLFTITPGVVRDASTGVPLSGVVVYAPSYAGIRAISDDSGRFELDLDAPVRLRLTRVGYAAMEIAAIPGVPLIVALTPAPQALEGVTVTALRGEASAPISRTQLSQREIESGYAGQEMPLILATLPSITATSDAGSESGYSYFRLRGLDQTRINITLDGIPLNEPEDQGLYFSNFADFANSIRSVQVQRGVGTSSYGTASYAGAVNFESIPLAASIRGGEAWLTGGSYETGRAALEYQTGLRPGGVAAYARVSAQTTDGYRHNGGNKSASAFLSGGYFGNRHIFKATLLSGDSRNEMAYVAAPVESLEEDRRFNPLGSDERDRFSQHLLSIAHTAALGSFTSLATTLYHMRAGGDYDVRIDPDLYNFNLGSAWTGILTTVTTEPGALTLNAGAHATTYRRDHWLAIRPDLDQRLYTNTGRKEEASTFAKAALATGRATIVADLQLRTSRFEYVPDVNSGVSMESIRWTFLNPRVGITVDASPRLSFYTSVGRTGREPTRNDMFAGFDNLDASNAAFIGPFDRVRPEFVTDLEAGFAAETPFATVRANGFWMSFRDEITPVGQLSYIGLPLRKNVERSSRRGLELDATLRGIPRIEGTVSAALMRGRIREYTDDASGVTYRDVEPLLTPNFTAAHDLRWTVTDRVALSLAGRYAGESFLANTGDSRFVLPPSYVADLGFHIDGERRILQLIFHNVFDADRYAGGYTDGSTSYYYVHAARHFSLTARLRFGNSRK